MPAALCVRIADVSRYLLAGALSVGGLPGRFMRVGAAPVVIPWSVLARGATSRMLGGAAGGDVCEVFWAVEEVPAWLIVELFRP